MWIVNEASSGRVRSRHPSFSGCLLTLVLMDGVAARNQGSGGLA
jgi:hypothetical protein